MAEKSRPVTAFVHINRDAVYVQDPRSLPQMFASPFEVLSTTHETIDHSCAEIESTKQQRKPAVMRRGGGLADDQPEVS